MTFRPALGPLIGILALNMFGGVDAPTTSRQLETLGARLSRLVERLGDWGFEGAVAVGHHGKTVLLTGVGTIDSTRAQRIDERTVFDLGSVSKQFTAVAVMILVDAGRVQLDAPIARYFDAVPPDKAAITLHQLLTHTSGMPREVAPDFTPMTREEFEQRAFAAPLVAAPGERVAYSNAGYRLAAAIVERVSGDPFSRYLHAHVFDPMGMRHTGFYDEIRGWGSDVSVARARGSAIDGQAPSERRADWSNVGSGGVVSTAEDLLTWERAMQDKRVIATRSWARIFTPSAGRFGYGWMISTGARPLIEHSGRWYAYNSDVRRAPSDSLAIIVLSNRWSGADGVATPVAAMIQRTVRGENVAMPPEVMRRESARACVGAWRLPTGGRILVRADSVQVNTEGEDALLALNGVLLDETARDSLAARKARTLSILREAWDGEFTTLRAVTATARGERYASALRDWRTARADSLGMLRKVEAIEALPTDSVAGPWTITARLEFDRGIEFVRMGWEQGGSLTILVTESAPIAEWTSRFRVTGRDRISSYDIASGALVDIRCSSGRQLTIERGGRRWVARMDGSTDRRIDGLPVDHATPRPAR